MGDTRSEERVGEELAEEELEDGRRERVVSALAEAIVGSEEERERERDEEGGLCG